MAGGQEPAVLVSLLASFSAGGLETVAAKFAIWTVLPFAMQFKYIIIHPIIHIPEGNHAGSPNHPNF